MSRRMSYSERDFVTQAKWALLSRRTREEPGLQFTSLVPLQNEGFPKACYCRLDFSLTRGEFPIEPVASRVGVSYVTICRGRSLSLGISTSPALADRHQNRGNGFKIKKSKLICGR